MNDVGEDMRIILIDGSSIVSRDTIEVSRGELRFTDRDGNRRVVFLVDVVEIAIV
jgi:hypothetical protein